jgi:hypothetical protein
MARGLTPSSGDGPAKTERLQDAHTHLTSKLHLTPDNQGIVCLAEIANDTADDNQEQKWRTLTAA